MNGVAIRDIDYPGILELGEHAADRFNRQAEIVRDILTCHRDIDSVPVGRTAALREMDEERRHALQRALSTENDEMILRRPQIVAQIGEDFLAHVAVFIAEPVEPSARITNEGHIVERLGRQGMLFKPVDTEEVSRQSELR